jgi:hypothetical protein
LASLFANGLAILFFIVAVAFPSEAELANPVDIALLTAAAIGAATALPVRRLEQRVSALER